MSPFSFVSDGPDHKAFLSLIRPKSGFVGTTLFAGNDESELEGINAAGLAVGYGVDSEVPGTPPALVVKPGRGSLHPLQPACSLPGCFIIVYQPPCALGGCVSRSVSIMADRS